MSAQKLPSTVDLDTLLEALKSNEPVVIEDTSDVNTFIAQFNILPGSYPISKAYLYKLYKGWSKNPISRNSFTIHLNRYFISSQYKFCIDKPALNISPELQKLLAPKRKYTKNPNNHKHFKYFLDKYNIKEGNYWIEGYILFSLYDSWTYQIRKEKPIKQYIFLELCEIFFETKTIDNTKYFQVDKSILNHLSEKIMEELRNGYKNYENGKKKKKEGNPKK